MRLDDAHRAFEALDVDGFDDVDVIGEEDSIFLDANWVVVRQDPAAGTKEEDTGATIKLEVGNEDDSEVLEMIPADSPFALEMAPNEEPEPTDEPSPTTEAAPDEDETAAPTETPETEEDADITACVRRKGNPGEIFVWYSYGKKPDATRLGAGFVWDFGDKKCITSTEFALNSNPGLRGYCTEVGKVAANAGYPVDARPAPRIPNIIGAVGDC